MNAPHCSAVLPQASAAANPLFTRECHWPADCKARSSCYWERVEGGRRPVIRERERQGDLFGGRR